MQSEQGGSRDLGSASETAVMLLVHLELKILIYPAWQWKEKKKEVKEINSLKLLFNFY